MSEEDATANQVGVQHQEPSNSPPSSPDTADGIADHKMSRKREREISLEPSTPRTAANDGFETGHSTSKDTRTPAKKGRVQLDATEEEDREDSSQARTPPQATLLGLSTSPPHEIKVRQISRGVEDMTWQNKLKDTANKVAEEQAPATIVSHGHNSPPRDEKIETLPASSQVTEIAGSQSTALLEPFNGASGRQSPRESDSDSADQEKGLKRKLGDRATSQGPEAGKNLGPEHPKRLRDDANKDDNPRETKRPSPPPEKSEPKASTSKFGGFMAYASSNSPFASVKGQNIFSSKPTSPSPSPFPTTSFAASPFSSLDSSTSKLPHPQTPAATPAKRIGFEAFASVSPFASRSKSPTGFGSGIGPHRSKSPSRRANPASVNAFSSYATGGAHGFTIPATKRVRADSPSGGSSRSSLERTSSANVLSGDGDTKSDDSEVDDRQTSFGERLRAGKDEEEESKSDEEQAKMHLTEQETTTGEEEEETIHQIRGKLFSLSPQNQWKERGTGTLKLNVRRSDGGGARLVMRKEAVYTVILNVTLFSGMKCFIAQDPRYLRFSVIEDGVTSHYNLRVSNAKIAEDLLEEINTNIPST